jgi:hypothetical protein
MFPPPPKEVTMHGFEARGRSRIALAVVMALTLALAPVTPARAEEESGGSFDWPKFFDYAGCAASIAFAELPGGLAMVGITCGRVIQKYWT